MAVEGILRRTLKAIRHFRRKTRPARAPWTETGAGEIDLLETLERAAVVSDFKPEDIVVQTREEQPLNLVMMIDTSLSMTGRKLALSAVGAAVLALRLRAEAYSLIAFGSTARALKPLGREMTPQETILAILDAPMLGYTNIEAGLRRGAEQLRRGRAPVKVGILLTDGKHTEGGDPEPAARLFRRLEVLMTLDHNMDRDCCYRLARAGRGRVTEVRRYAHLPERLLGLLRNLRQ
ncbi:MAG TPA: vWA domain-containing protein [Sumerlaeia bacterium]|nr:vWA domain-containing protein [Sumerlaeia bacterium]